MGFLQLKGLSALDNPYLLEGSLDNTQVALAIIPINGLSL